MSVNKHNSTAILASFATLKSLLDEKKYKSSYQVLQEFIHYIIINESIFSFTAIEIKNHLYNYFGFSIPEAVIKTAAKKMTGVQLNNGSYTVRFEELGNDSLFQDAGFKLKELIIKEQHNCKATGYWKTNSVKYNFLLIAHEYLFVFKK